MRSWRIPSSGCCERRSACCRRIVSRLVLVIDQFEELFTLVADEDERRRFLENLVAAIDDPYGRVLTVLTLRADSYHRPLATGSSLSASAPAS